MQKNKSNIKEEQISVINAAKKLGMRKQTLFKKLKKLKIESFKEKSENHNGQAIAFIRKSDLELIKNQEISPQKKQNISTVEFQITEGYFYLIQLEPKFDIGRFKVGFAKNVNERLRSHKCSAPFAKIIAKWECKSLWEKTAIDSVTQNCEKLHTEVFRTDDLNSVLKKCEQFFRLMPKNKNGS